MSKVLVYYAHPGHRKSRANRAMVREARKVTDITFIDLYAQYPRFEINVDRDQQRLLDHDMIVFQYPLFWYAAPALLKEWIDLVLEHGFAYGHDGDALAGKRMMVAVTAAGTEEAYTPKGYQHHDLPTFLTPMEQTARLCKMDYLPPYVLYGSLRAPENGEAEAHAKGYRALLEGLRDDRLDLEAAAKLEVLTHTSLPLGEDA